MGSKARKAQQRQAYHNAFKKFKHNHGGLAMRKKEVSALGSTTTRGAMNK